MFMLTTNEKIEKKIITNTSLVSVIFVGSFTLRGMRLMDGYPLVIHIL